MISGPITSWQIDRETIEIVTDFIFLGSKITADVTAAMKLKDTCSLEEKTGSKLGKEYIKDVYCHPAYLTCMQSTSCEMLGW